MPSVCACSLFWMPSDGARNIEIYRNICKHVYIRKLKILISIRRILVLVVVFSFQILIEKVLKNGSFRPNLGFGCVFSCSNST